MVGPEHRRRPVGHRACHWSPVDSNGEVATGPEPVNGGPPSPLALIVRDNHSDRHDPDPGRGAQFGSFPALHCSSRLSSVFWMRPKIHPPPRA